MKLYELSQELQEIEQRINQYAKEHDGDITDCPLEKLFEKIEMEKRNKCLSIAVFIKNLRAEANAIKDEKNKLAKRERSLNNKADRIERYLINNIESGEKLSNSQATINWIKSERLIVDIEKISKRYKKVKEEPDKILIKAVLKTGKKLKGAYLESRNNIQIK